MTFNILGSQHTAPVAPVPTSRPAGSAAEWAKNLIIAARRPLVGLSEPQPDQITSLDVATNGELLDLSRQHHGLRGARRSR